MKQKIKRIKTVALTLSLVLGIAGVMAPISVYAGTYTITFNPNGGNCDTTSASTEDNGTLASLPEASYEGRSSLGWYTDVNNGVQVYANETEFNADTTIFALWSDTSGDENPQPQPSPEPESEPEAPSEPEDPYAKKQEEADKQLEDAINSVQSVVEWIESGSNESPGLFIEIAKSGLTLDMGDLLSFKKDTYDKISRLVSLGVPVTIKYIHNGENRSLTIPRHCKANLGSYCDETGFIGFENLKGQLIRDKYIEASKEDIAGKEVIPAFIQARDNVQAFISISPADNAATANSEAGTTSTPINGGFTPFAAFGGSKLRAESG